MKPVNFYFDESILKKEKVLFDQIKYISHTFDIAQDMNYRCLPQEKDGRILVKNKDSYELVSNVCRHRQAIMLQGQGNIEHIQCPLHSWTYDLSGKIKTAPYFDDCSTRHLTNYPMFNWNGMLFEQNQYTLQNNVLDDLNTIKFSNNFNFKNYAYHSSIEHMCNYNWKTFIEVYLDDYHVKPFHPGLGNFVDCDNLEWQFGRSFSVQSVGIYQKLSKPGTPVYKTWQDVLMNYRQGSVPTYGAIWLTIYPNIMVEWYPEVLVISTLWPESSQKTKNIVQFYYPEDICFFEPEFVAAHQAAYMETCDEDDEIAERMDHGRSILKHRQENDIGPVQKPMELGLDYFYQYYDLYVK